jgi:hypothetical protein
MDRPTAAAGVLLVRAWVEDGSPSGLRARITQTRDLTSDEQIITIAASIDEVCRTVRAWLEELVDQRPAAP